MPKFKYTAVNKQNKKLTGVIEASDVNAAQVELNILGLSILEIAPATESGPIEEGKIIFQFSATDKSGKKIAGTIKSTDERTAFIKLTQEYNFDVLELSSTIDNLKNQINIIDLKSQVQAAKPIDDENFSADMNSDVRKDIQIKIEQILQRVHNSLEQMQDKLKPEARTMIKKQIDKLQLIKSSTNVEYIQESAEKLLQEIQNQENYTAASEIAEEKNQLALDTQKLMIEIRQEKGGKATSISDSLTARIKSLSNIQLNDSTGIIKRLLKDISGKILAFFENPPEIKNQKIKIALVNSQIWEYRKKWLFEKNNRTEIIAALNTLKSERERLQKELNSLRNIKNPSIAIEHSETKQPVNLIAANTFTGWLLCFYLIYYFFGFILSQKNLGFNANFSWNFNVFSVPLIKQFIIASFIIHGATSLKIVFFRYNRLSNLFLWLVTPVILVIALLNL